MKVKQSAHLLAAGVCAAGLFTLTPSAHAALTVADSFGSIPGAPANAYGKSDIPQNNSVVQTISGIPGPTALSPSDTLTLALSTTAHGPVNPAPVIIGPGVFGVQTGTSGGASKWNYDFYLSDANGNIAGYNFTITVKDIGSGTQVSYNPLTAIGDNAGLPAFAGNSERLDFGFTQPAGYNPNANDTYVVELQTSRGGVQFGDLSETIVAGTGAVPEASTYIAAALLLIPFGISGFNFLRKKRATV